MDEYEVSFLRALDEIDPPPGIDVRAWRNDVRRYVLSHFRGRLRVARIEVDDAVAEVLMGLVIRNRGTCPWRHGGRSRAAYVYMVTAGVVNNMVRRRLYRLRHEVHTLNSRHVTYADVDAIDSDHVGSLVSTKREDTHRYLVEQQPARTQLDPVLLDDLGREFADKPHVRTWVRCTVNGMQRQEIMRSGALCSHRITEAHRLLRRFLLE